LTADVYLQTYLAPLAQWLLRVDVTDILVNRPGEVWIEEAGGRMERVEAPGLSAPILQRLAQQIAAVSHQGVNREHPLLAATLPSGERVQVIVPPATRADVVMAIRKHVMADLTLETYDRMGAFRGVRRTHVDHTRGSDPHLDALLDAGNIFEFMREAVRGGKTILVSGGTASGKTTFLNALLKEIPAGERLIAIEDTPEIQLAHPNSVGLVAVKGELGEARIGVNELMQAALRMRPDRLLVGEVRGAEAFTFLRAINTGHPGSITTVHADSPRGALEQIAFMALQAGTSLGRAEIIAYAREVIDVIVQLQRIGGRRGVAAIAFNRGAAGEKLV
jgi:type IV secretion system protein VirB11